MSWDLATARNALKVPAGDTTKDAAIGLVMNETLAAIETYLGRGLLYKRETVKFYDTDWPKIRLPRYPIGVVHSPRCRLVHHRVGWIEPDWGTVFWNYRTTRTGGLYRTMTVDYEGGFNPLPSDLLRAMWEAFMDLWSRSDQATGAPKPGAGPTIVQGSGEISKIVYPDGGSVTWDVGATVSGGSSGSSAADYSGMGWLAPWGYLLSTYRSEAAPSIAFA